MPKILIIDDEPAIRKALKEILEYEQFEVSEAEDGPTALKIVEKESFDLIFCDIKMPRMDGMEVLGSSCSLRFSVPRPHAIIENSTAVHNKALIFLMKFPVILFFLLPLYRTKPFLDAEKR